jgi:integrase
MRTLKVKYTDHHGRRGQTPNWYCELKDPSGVMRRFPGFTDRTATEELGRKIERLVAFRVAGGAPDPTLAAWIAGLHSRLRSRLEELGILDARRHAATRPIRELLEAFRESLCARERTPKHVAQVVARAERLLESAGVRVWNDLGAIEIERALKAERERGLSAQTSNHLLSAVRQFARWVVLNGMAPEDPLRVLRPLNVRMDRRLVRRALEPDELQALLRAAMSGPVRQGMTGPERALLYRLAAESGLRANELRSLTVASFELASDRPTVRLQAGASKRRREDVLPLQTKMARALKAHLGECDHAEPAFALLASWRAAEMLAEDRDAAGIDVSDGLAVDFHSLRHTFISNLVRAGVTPRVVQALARHSTPMLTFGVYAHLGADDERQALAMLPDLSAAWAQTPRRARE